MSLIKMLLLISLLIIVHELGHFLVAKAFKMKVSRFGIGLPIGPAIYEKKIGGIIYCIHWFLFGGYVSFPDDDKDNGLPKDSPDLFKNKPIYQRTCVISAGVIANVIMAYVIIMFCCLHWHQLPNGQFDVYVGEILKSAPASTVQSGLKTGDRIVSVNGRKIVYPMETSIVSQRSQRFDGKITEQQYQKVLKSVLSLNPDLSETSIIKNGDKVNLPQLIQEDEVVLSEADALGLKDKTDYMYLDKDHILIRNEAMNKTSYYPKKDIQLKDIVLSIADTYSPINLVVERDGKMVNLKPLYTNTAGYVGYVPNPVEKVTKINSFSDAINASNNYMWRNTVFSVWSLKLLVTGQVPVKEMKGIVAITKIGSDVIEKRGMMKGLILTALISLSLAIFNILPIPALDGGHLFFLAVEKIKGSPLDEKIIENISTAFFALLIAFMIFIVGMDILFIMGK